ncbi:MAG: rod shape-determining protein MreC [Bacteroidota bacterium]
MQQIINFIVRFKTGLVFLMLLTVSLILTIRAHSFHQNKWITSTNYLSAYFYKNTSAVSDYFNLKKTNDKLVEENAWLRERLINTAHLDSLNDEVLPQKTDSIYDVIPAKIISNSFRKLNNYLLINKGENNKVVADMGVVSSKGVVGIVEASNDKYARIISVLNANISINAQLQKSKHYGSLTWNGNKTNITQLLDVPRSASIVEGDTIITGGNSLIFPEGIPIGKVENYQLDENRGYYEINVRLFNDMTSLGDVYIISNRDREAAIDLMKLENE